MGGRGGGVEGLLKDMNLLHQGANLFSIGVAPIWKGFIIQGSHKSCFPLQKKLEQHGSLSILFKVERKLFKPAAFLLTFVSQPNL